MMKTLAVLIATTALAAPAWAVNKCTGPDGKVVFQDAPCAGKGERIDVRPASGASSVVPRPAAPAASAAAPAPMTEAQRLEGVLASSQAQRRRTDLEALLVPQAKQAIDRNRSQCDQEMQGLRARKAAANNNLAGATWEASLSQEMQAVATRCDTKHRELRDDHETLLTECRQLGGCKR